ncbi:iron ABC transporter permease [Variovorax sp. PCZ-1]|nr:iron ABC transporter permease [Variovorax sp. PCZ-1]
MLLGLCVGSAGFENLLRQWWQGSPQDQALAGQLIWEIRLPRTLGAWAAGALLGLAGAVAQGMFRNPLADPYLLGSSAGAALGVALMLVMLGGAAGMLSGAVEPGSWQAWLQAAGRKGAGLQSGNAWLKLGLTGAAFVGATAGVMLTLVLARGVQHTLRLLLAGVIVGVLLGAATSLILLLSPDSLQAMQTFLLGSTGFVGWSASAIMLAVWLPCTALAWGLARALDALSLGQSTAQSLGLPLQQVRIALVAVLALATGTAVAQTGLIAFVGLAAPHMVRALIRCTHGPLLWCASLMGAVLLCTADLAARWLIAPQELPVGALTAVLGGLYLLRLMHAKSGGLSSTSVS